MTGRGATATSSDGRVFSVPGAPFPPGDLVTMQTPEGIVLGQVVEGAVDGTRSGGVVLGLVDGAGTLERGPRVPFVDAPVGEADPDHLVAVQVAGDADLPVGTWRSGGATVPARLRAQGFGRHTFLCGQSGSGKTYALGLLLEQLHLGTGLRMVVLDPNADYVQMNHLRDGVAPDLAERWSAEPVTVLGSDATGATPLRLRFATMPRAAQAALLRLDPLADRGEYNLFVRDLAQGAALGIGDVVAGLRSGGPHEQALAQRIENLGLLEWEVWAGHSASASEVVADGSSMTVLDLNGFRDPHESTAVCLDLVEQLWAQRAARTPTLIVIDEAHNLCPAAPSGPLQQALVERLIQIAAEGRKYGLWLLLSTQRPSKLHPQVLSQCDNLVLMRMNSRADLAEIATTFGGVPPALLDASPGFVQGEALVAGPLVPVPTLLRMGDRLTREGGSDVRVPDSPRVP